MAASDYTGKEKASLANIKEMIENGASLQQIRGAMGLGYSLGTLDAVNGGTGVNNLQDVADAIVSAMKEIYLDQIGLFPSVISISGQASGTAYTKKPYADWYVDCVSNIPFPTVISNDKFGIFEVVPFNADYTKSKSSFLSGSDVSGSDKDSLPTFCGYKIKKDCRLKFSVTISSPKFTYGAGDIKGMYTGQSHFLGIGLVRVNADGTKSILATSKVANEYSGSAVTGGETVTIPNLTYKSDDGGVQFKRGDGLQLCFQCAPSYSQTSGSTSTVYSMSWSIGSLSKFDFELKPYYV